jgi:hypothetical protein
MNIGVGDCPIRRGRSNDAYSGANGCDEGERTRRKGQVRSIASAKGLGYHREGGSRERVEHRSGGWSPVAYDGRIGEVDEGHAAHYNDGQIHMHRVRSDPSCKVSDTMAAEVIKQLCLWRLNIHFGEYLSTKNEKLQWII